MTAIPQSIDVPAQQSFSIAEQVRRAVGQVAAMRKITVFATSFVVIGLPVLGHVIAGEIGWALFLGFILFLISKLVLKVIDVLLLTPVQNHKFKRAAKLLNSEIASQCNVVNSYYWWNNPGTLCVSKDGRIILALAKTDYEARSFNRSDIVKVSVEREATQYTDTHHSGRFTLGGVSRGGLLGGYTTGGKSTSVTTVVETAFLEIRCQNEQNGPVETYVVPFGQDRRAADELCILIERLKDD